MPIAHVARNHINYQVPTAGPLGRALAPAAAARSTNVNSLAQHVSMPATPAFSSRPAHCGLSSIPNRADASRITKCGRDLYDLLSGSSRRCPPSSARLLRPAGCRCCSASIYSALPLRALLLCASPAGLRRRAPHRQLL